jgi:hypothetical protein
MSPKRPGWRRRVGARALRWATSMATATRTSYFTCYGDNALYRNNGNGTFTDVTRTGGRG